MKNFPIKKYDKVWVKNSSQWIEEIFYAAPDRGIGVKPRFPFYCMNSVSSWDYIAPYNDRNNVFHCNDNLNILYPTKLCDGARSDY